MVQSLTEKHTLPIGTLSFSATAKNPLVFYTAKAGHRGNIGMGILNEGKEFVIIPAEYLEKER